MRADIDTMAKELGLRPDQLRIRFGLPTRNQRSVASAQTMRDIVSLYPVFRKDQRDRCGPQSEQEDKERYFAQRIKIFVEFLAGLNTVDDYLRVDVRELLPDEYSDFRQKLNALMDQKLIEAEGVDGLESFAQTLSTLHSRFEGISLYSVEKTFAEKALKEFVADLCKVASMESLADTFMRWDWLRGKIGSATDKASWDFVWGLIPDIPAALALREKFDTRWPPWQLTKGFYKRIRKLLPSEVEKRAKEHGFENALALAMSINEDRDNFRLALILCIPHIKTVADCIALRKQWWRMGNDHRYDHEFFEPFAKKWDEIHLYKAQSSEDLDWLHALEEDSPHGSKTRDVCVTKIKSYVSQRINEISDLDALRQFSREIRDRFGYAYTSGEVHSNRESTLARSRALNLFETANDKRTLIGLYHEFSDDPEKQMNILRRLVSHFPAEEVEVDEVEV